MFLYSLTLQQPTGIHLSVFGNFSSASAQELAVSRGKSLELYRVSEGGDLDLVLQEEVFGIIRSMITFRMTGSSKDLLVVGSDSGKIVFFEVREASLVTVHAETFGKTGCRRIVPGQYLAADPKGRAVLVAAVEKQKFVYILNRDASNRITISSPLEGHKTCTVLFDMVGVDVGFENPLFACLEVEYGDPQVPTSPVVTGDGQMVLVCYEMDLGLNHVVRKVIGPVHRTAHRLIPVPGAPDGPGGLLICDEHCITYHSLSREVVKCRYPRRADMSDEHGMFLLNWAAHKQKDTFFFLVQSEAGDVYKVTLTGKERKELSVQYFDTLAPCTSVNIVKSGFLFAAAEEGNHCLYQFVSIGDEEILQHSGEDVQVYFMPRTLKNLHLIAELSNFSTITDMKVADLAEEGTPQIYALCSKGPRSTLRVLRHGLGVTEIANTQLPGKPTDLWTVSSFDDSLTRYIVISFLNATVILQVSDSISEVSTTGFDTSVGTLHANVLANHAYLQVTSSQVNMITSDGPVTWSAPGKIRVAASNPRQVAVCLQGGKLCYFEVTASGSLSEIALKELEQEVTCIDICPIPTGRVRARFVAIGCYDNTVKVLSLDAEGCLRRLSTQILPASRAYSVKFVEQKTQGQTDLYLTVGLETGVMLRTVVDSITGQFSDTRAKQLGSRPVGLHRTVINKEQGIVALTSRSYASYQFMGTHLTMPIVSENLNLLASFTAENCPEGYVGVTGHALKFFTLDRLGETFSQTVVPLTYTPKKMELDEQSRLLYIVESDHNAFPMEQRQKLKEAIGFDDSELTDAVIGTPQAGDGRWASHVRVFNPLTLETVDIIPLADNETAVSLCITTFSRYETDRFAVIGTVKDLRLTPRSHSGAYLSVYRITKAVEFIHKTQVDDVPLALCSFYGQLLVGVGKYLRLYELGQRQMLKKCENRTTFSNLINTIRVHEERIFVSDINESISVLIWRAEDNQLVCFADDVVPRWLTHTTLLDHDTVALADKFENVLALRLPAACEEDEKDLNGVRLKWEAGFLNAAYYKMEHVAHFYVGDLVTAMQRVALSEHNRESLVYVTSMGAIAGFLPITSKEEVEFFVHLEMYLRQEIPGLLGRDHTSFRSSYAPVKDVIDGDLCEQYAKLPYHRQRQLAEQLEHSPQEILRRLEEFRTHLL